MGYIDHMIEDDPDHVNRPVAWAAEVSNDVTALGEDLFVTIRSIDGGRQAWGPCRWNPQVDAAGAAFFPSEGDQGLVVKDSEGEYWLLMFWTYG